MEANTYATSTFIAASVEDARAYLADGASLSEYTLFSRMQERIDEHTWLGTASGYQRGLYYHVEQRRVGDIAIVEWHCGHELGAYFHVYPMLLIPPSYFGSTETGSYYHWISFVDPARATPMIKQGLPVVHRSEARSLKAQLERRAGHRSAVQGALDVQSHTIFVQATVDEVAGFLGDPANVATWGYLMRQDGERLLDEYDRPIRIELRTHDLGRYRLIEHATHHDDGVTINAPLLVFPCSFAFSPGARGVILHRLSAWPRSIGKQSPDDYDTEAINAKRIIEARAGDLASYAKGCSYVPEGG